MRTLATRARAINQYNGLGNQLWDLAGNRPSLDLRFAESKSLVDATTGTNLIDHTRASSGTYVGSDGLIKTATTNLLLQSEDFSTTWINLASTETVNAIIAPNGTLSADKIVSDNTLAFHGIVQTVTAGSQVYVFSVYLKAGEYTSASIRAGRSGNFVNADFDLTTGAVSALDVNGTATNPNANSEEAGNGWYRVWVSGANLGDGQINVYIYPNNDVSYTGDNVKGIYAWGAQLEQSSTVGEYIKTTSTINSAPRFDHDPVTGECLGLLVEESRTNLLVSSEEFDQATTDWFQGDSTIDSDAIEAPDGNNTADKLIATGGAAEHHVRKEFSATAGTTYTFSCFLKAAERSSFGLAFRVAGVWPSGQNQVIEFTLTGNGSYSVTAGSPTGDIIALGNGWYRCHITATAAVTGTAQARVQDVYDADDAGIYLWGAQLEEGSFPTSYIPTVDAGVITPGYTTPAVTRAADVASISGSNFSSWYRQDAGTARVEWHNTVEKQWAGYSAFFALRNLNSTEYIGYGVTNGGNKYQVYWSAKAGNNGQLAYGAYSPGFPNVPEGSWTHAIALTTNDAAFYEKGFQRKIDDSVIMPNPTEAIFDTTNTCLKRVTFWPQRLPNPTLSTITQ